MSIVALPEGYERGVAAYDTVSDAEAFAREMNKQTGFQHKVVVDNHAGCAVVECTSSPIRAFAEGTTLEGYEQSYAHLRRALSAEEAPLKLQGRDVLEHENALDADISEWNVVYCKTIVPDKEETMFDFEVRVRVMIDKESKKLGKLLNAFLLRHNTEGDFDRKVCFLLIMFPSELQDFEGNEIAENDILYTLQENTPITVQSIELEEQSDFEDMCDNKYHHIPLKYSQRFCPRMFGVGAVWFYRYWTCKSSDTTQKFYTAKNLKKTLWSDEDRQKLYELSLRKALNPKNNTKTKGSGRGATFMDVVFITIAIAFCLVGTSMIVAFFLGK